MKIFILLSLLIIAVFFFGKKFLNAAKKNLFKDQEAWSGKDIKIKYSKSTGNIDSKGNDNYLKIIADESKIFLEDQSSKEEK
tara:strand:+ start:277 stop:522 length:246 start_codon:yes stop_codon:yes gene_type:complete